MFIGLTLCCIMLQKRSSQSIAACTTSRFYNKASANDIQSNMERKLSNINESTLELINLTITCFVGLFKVSTSQ
jgi:hypothetical protein